MLKKMSIYYLNIRDAKSKWDSFKERIAEIKPSIIALTETWLTKDDEIELEGYDLIFRNERDEKGGGILIAVHNNIRNVVCEVSRSGDIHESLWIVLDNTKVKMKLGVLYFPQEKDVTQLEMETIYETICEEIREGRGKDQTVIIVGDFNCKVGGVIPGNKTEKTSGGKQLLQLRKEQKMELMNATDKCKGLWTRSENGSKSVLDYVLISKENCDRVIQMQIDEEKDLAPLRVKKDKGSITKTVYSDHNVILLRLDLIEPERKIALQRSYRTRITEAGYEKIAAVLEEQNVSKIWDEDGSFQERYNKWTAKVKVIEDQYSTKIRKKAYASKAIRLYRQLRKSLKMERNEANEERKEGIRKEREELRVMILVEEKEEKVRKITKVVERISMHGKIQFNAFSEFRKHFKRRDDKPHAMVDANGNTVHSEKEIKGVYEDFYKNLLNNEEEQKVLPTYGKVEKKFQAILEVAKNQEPLKVTVEDVDAMKRCLKRKKAQDQQGWRNESILDAGEEMSRSLAAMFSIVLEEEVIPDQWETMLIKSTHKKGQKSLMKNKRGLFLTNIISKAFEKTVEIKMGPVKYDKDQAGGTKGRAPIDNWIALMALRDQYRYYNQDLYLYFCDLVKCFDKLWLRDCLVDLYECGAREREVKMLYVLNKRARAKIITPMGITDEIEIREAVKEGTVFSPKFYWKGKRNRRKDVHRSHSSSYYRSTCVC